MTKVISYLRVSTKNQDLQNQKYEILDYCHKSNLQIDEFIEIEISSRKNLKCRKIDKLMSLLEPDDILIVSELSRIGRSTREVLNIINQMLESGITVHIIKQNMILRKNGDMQSKIMVTMMSLFAELERDLISQRIKSALEAKRASGVRLGRPKGSIGKSKLDCKEEQIRDFLAKQVSISSIAKICGVSRNTVYNFIDSRNLKSCSS